MLKNEIAEIIALRKIQIEEIGLVEAPDYKEILYILSRNYSKTIGFLKTSTFNEIGVASWVLDELIELFPTQELIDCFKSRVEEFTEHDEDKDGNKSSIILNSFKESVAEAEEYLNKFNCNN